jgi:hypothetical protein
VFYSLQDHLRTGTHNIDHPVLAGAENTDNVIHKICAKLWFCEKEPSDEDKIEKTLTTMLP